MIITLKNADFSQNNIGTLDSWGITKILRGVTTDNDITRVEKNARYEATFNIKEGYILSEFKVTMGNDDITATALVWTNSYKTANLYIPEVIGNVYILIKASSTGAEKPELPGETKILKTPYIKGIAGETDNMIMGKYYTYEITNTNDVAVSYTCVDSDNGNISGTLEPGGTYYSAEDLSSSNDVYIDVTFNAEGYESSNSSLQLMVWAEPGTKFEVGGE